MKTLHGFHCFDSRLTETYCKRRVIHCFKLITLKCIPSQSDHFGMTVNESIKYFSQSSPYWAAALMYGCQEVGYTAVTISHYCNHGCTPSNKGEGLVSQFLFSFCSFFYALLSSLLFEKPAAVWRKWFLGTGTHQTTGARSRGQAAHLVGMQDNMWDSCVSVIVESSNY